MSDGIVDTSVVIVGAGPTGLMLAAELALAGTDVVVVERRVDQHVDGSRAGGLLPRTIEVLDQRGVADRFLDAGYTVPSHGFAGIRMDIADFPTRHPYVLALWQSEFEPILANWVDELGIRILRGREVEGFAQDETGIVVDVSDGTSLGAGYLVGCDGGRSVVRRTAGIEFAGWDPSTSWLVAEVATADLDGEPEFGMRYDEVGSHGIGPVGDGGSVRMVLTERELRSGPATIEDLREAVAGVYGPAVGVRRATWVSRFTDLARQAVDYRSGRVLLAGDAAHVHAPHGGQGLNTGVQDAVNLGWKLARVVAGTSPDRLLDTYHVERHPVAARVLRNTMAQVALSGGDDRHLALRDTMTELLALDEPRRQIAGMLTGLDIRYDLGDGHADHPVVGRRMPDLDLTTSAGPTRVYELMHGARPLLLSIGPVGGVDAAGEAGRVDRTSDGTPSFVGISALDVVEAQTEDRWELPVIGEVPAPTAVLIRPDGYVAWAGDRGDHGDHGDHGDPGLARALETWLGGAGRAA